MLRGLTTAAVLLLFGATLARAFEDQWWGFHLLAHFPLQIAALSAVTLVLALSLRLPLTITLAAITLLAQVPALSWTFGARPAEGTALSGHATQAALVVTTLNMGDIEIDQAAFLAYLDDKDPDLLLLQESYGMSPSLLKALSERFPHFAPRGRLRAHSKMLLSRRPILGARRIKVAHASVFLLSEIELAGRVVSILTLHAPNPIGRAGFERRNRLFDYLAKRIPVYPHPVILAGDFNTTPWSRYYRQLTRDGVLHNAAQSRGWLATWPAPALGAGIAIDHILVSDGIEVAWIAPGPNLGSDHRPITAWLTVGFD